MSRVEIKMQFPYVILTQYEHCTAADTTFHFIALNGLKSEEYYQSELGLNTRHANILNNWRP